jgi:hypothetical protein
MINQGYLLITQAKREGENGRELERKAKNAEIDEARQVIPSF